MNCKTCGRELESGEKDYCPACKNNNDEQQKTGMAKLGAILAVTAGVVFTVLKFSR